MSGISLGKAIYYILSGTTGLTAKIDDKVFPIFAPDETQNPFIVYNSRISNTFYSKDGLQYDECILTITIVTSNYLDNKDITEIVRTTLERKVGSFSGVYIIESLVSGVTEDYGIDGYITNLEFTFKVK